MEERNERSVRVGDKVTALLYDSREVAGVVVKQLDSMVSVRSADGRVSNTATSMCRLAQPEPSTKLKS